MQEDSIPGIATLTITPFSLLLLTALVVNSLLLIHTTSYLRSSKPAKTYLLFLICSTIWIVAHFLVATQENLAVATYISKLAGAPAIFSSIAMLRFVLVYLYPGALKNHLIDIVLVFVGSVVSYLSIATDRITTGAIMAYWGPLISRGSLYTGYSMLIALLSLTGIYLCTINLPKASGAKKSQLKLFIAAFMFPIIVGILTEVIAPIFKIVIPALTTTMFTVTSSIVFYAITKYQFLKLSSEFTMDTLINSMSDGIVAVDPQNMIAFCNQAFESITGFHLEEIQGRPLIDIVPALLQIHEEDARLAIEHNTSKIQRHLSVSTHDISSSLSVRVGKLFVLRDLTDTEALLEQVQDQKDDLQTKVEEIEKLNKLMINREMKMVKLKELVASLKKSLEDKEAMSSYSIDAQLADIDQLDT